MKQRSTVVLPQPDGPMKAVISCLWIVDVHVADGAEGAVVDAQPRDVEDDLGGGLGVGLVRDLGGDVDALVHCGGLREVGGGHRVQFLFFS